MDESSTVLSEVERNWAEVRLVENAHTAFHLRPGEKTLAALEAAVARYRQVVHPPAATRSGRGTSDEAHILDLCDEALGHRGLRQHRFEWLRGDVSPKTGRSVSLPVDGYWPELALVVEVHEIQHREAVRHFDKPGVATISGGDRGEQRRLYDERRAQLVPDHGMRLVIISTDQFELSGTRLKRSPEDLDVVRRLLASNASG